MTRHELQRIQISGCEGCIDVAGKIPTSPHHDPQSLVDIRCCAEKTSHSTPSLQFPGGQWFGPDTPILRRSCPGSAGRGFACMGAYGSSKRMSRLTRTVNLYPTGTLIVGWTLRFRMVIIAPVWLISRP